MIKKLLCKLNKKGHKISTHTRRCLKCNTYIPSKEKQMASGYDLK